jgi:hypothetical protein
MDTLRGRWFMLVNATFNNISDKFKIICFIKGELELLSRYKKGAGLTDMGKSYLPKMVPISKSVV